MNRKTRSGHEMMLLRKQKLHQTVCDGMTNVLTELLLENYWRVMCVFQSSH